MSSYAKTDSARGEHWRPEIHDSRGISCGQVRASGDLAAADESGAIALSSYWIENPRGFGLPAAGP